MLTQQMQPVANIHKQDITSLSPSLEAKHSTIHTHDEAMLTGLLYNLACNL